MKTKFTKGNWHVHQEGTSIQVWTDKPGEGRICTTVDRNKQEQTANAKLIAAAPELLETLQMFINCTSLSKTGQVTISTQQHIDAHQKAQSIIEKIS